jgi:hypothetical protein
MSAMKDGGMMSVGMMGGDAKSGMAKDKEQRSGEQHK